MTNPPKNNTPDKALVERSEWPWRPGCGPACRGYDPISGTCSYHGPSEQDKIVDRVTAGFRTNLQRIMGSNRNVSR